jgi:hypothetical protein
VPAARGCVPAVRGTPASSRMTTCFCLAARSLLKLCGEGTVTLRAFGLPASDFGETNSSSTANANRSSRLRCHDVRRDNCTGAHNDSSTSRKPTQRTPNHLLSVGFQRGFEDSNLIGCGNQCHLIFFQADSRGVNGPTAQSDGISLPNLEGFPASGNRVAKPASPNTRSKFTQCLRS